MHTVCKILLGTFKAIKPTYQLLFSTRSLLGFPGGSDGKVPACSAGDPGSIPGLGRSPGEGNGNPLQDSCLENPMDRGAWQATVYGIARVECDLVTKPPPASLVAQLAKNPPAMWETWVQSLGWEDPLEKGMATHSSILAWRIPRTEEPGSLQSMEMQRVRHN